MAEYGYVLLPSSVKSVLDEQLKKLYESRSLEQVCEGMLEITNSLDDYGDCFENGFLLKWDMILRVLRCVKECTRKIGWDCDEFSHFTDDIHDFNEAYKDEVLDSLNWCSDELELDSFTEFVKTKCPELDLFEW